VWTDPHYTPAPVNNRLSDRLNTGKRSGYIKSHPQTAAIENNTSPAVVVVVFFFEYNKSWTSVNSIGVGIFNCRSFGITEL